MRDLNYQVKQLCQRNCDGSFGTTQRKLDHHARLRISHELGHSREQISAVYLRR